MICPHCSQYLPEGLIMCFRCGNPLRGPARPPSSGKMNGLTGIIAAAAVAVFLGGAFGGHFLGLYSLPFMPEREAKEEGLPPEAYGTPGMASPGMGERPGVSPPDVSVPPETPPEAGKTHVVNQEYVYATHLASIPGRYTGDWENGAPNGMGEIVFTETVLIGNMGWREGARLTGAFVDGLLEGYGEYIRTDGARHEGHYAKGLRSGQGLEIFEDGSVFEGEYRDNARNGPGKFVWTDGRYLEGEFRDGQLNGQGLYIDGRGARYEGEFVNGEFNGRGRYIWSDGTYYEGEFKDNMLHGEGVLRDANGVIRLEGTWVNDEYQQSASPASVREGVYISDKGAWTSPDLFPFIVIRGDNTYRLEENFYEGIAVIEGTYIYDGTYLICAVPPDYVPFIGDSSIWFRVSGNDLIYEGQGISMTVTGDVFRLEG